MEKKVKKQELHCRDGSTKVWEKELKYHGMVYTLQLNRYFSLFTPLSEMKGFTDINMWFKLVNPTSQKKDAQIYDHIFKEEFLNYDTYHSHQVAMSLEEMFYSIVDIAQRPLQYFHRPQR